MLLIEVSLSQYCLVLQSFMLTNVTYEYFDYENFTYVNTCYLCSYGFLLLFVHLTVYSYIVLNLSNPNKSRIHPRENDMSNLDFSSISSSLRWHI